jgi:hypothetical protein
VTTHLHKLERLAAAAKSFPAFDAAQAASDDRRAAWCYRLLHARGSSAVVRPADAEHMMADGMNAADIAAVQDHLAMLRVNDLVPTRHSLLQNLLDANGAPANATNVSVIYAQAGRFEHRRDLWHPHSRTSRKRFQIADFMYSKRDAAELAGSAGDQVASGPTPAQADAAR